MWALRRSMRSIRPRLSQHLLPSATRSTSALLQESEPASAFTRAPSVSAVSIPSTSPPWEDSRGHHPWRANGAKRFEGMWGTAANPVPIASSGDSRVVACAGQPSRPSHDLKWITVHRGMNTSCPECNQVFMLTSK